MQEAAITLAAAGSEQGRNLETKEIPARLRFRSSEEGCSCCRNSGPVVLALPAALLEKKLAGGHLRPGL